MKDVIVIFCDVDGNLSMHGVFDPIRFNTLSSIIKNAEIKKIEIHLVLCSGRPAPYLQAITGFLGEVFTPFCIGENGSMLVIKNGVHFWYESLIPKKDRKVIFEVKRKLRQLEYDHPELYVENGKDYSITVKLRKFGTDIQVLYSMVFKILYEYFGYKIIEKLSVVTTSDSVDVFSNKTSKASGLEEVLKRYNEGRVLVPRDTKESKYRIVQLIYSGDSGNDVEAASLIKAKGGTVIAPQNAIPPIKKIADIVGDGVAIDGVISALKRYLSLN